MRGVAGLLRTLVRTARAAAEDTPMPAPTPELVKTRTAARR